MNELVSHMLDKPSVVQERCAVCGRKATNNHHVIPKGMGGTKLESRIPTIALCGMGNASGCHGLAHSGILHFRYREGWECCVTNPMTYAESLETGEWFPLPCCESTKWGSKWEK